MKFLQGFLDSKEKAMNREADEAFKVRVLVNFSSHLESVWRTRIDELQELLMKDKTLQDFSFNDLATKFPVIAVEDIYLRMVAFTALDFTIYILSDPKKKLSKQEYYDLALKSIPTLENEDYEGITGCIEAFKRVMRTPGIDALKEDTLAFEWERDFPYNQMQLRSLFS